ncbi:MAG: hypothetical protein LZF60_80437 [Nitrospira sp.]|nr:MAG: hypothetical protein LZF60_80437 [Nitrospira sp.]
MWSSGVSTPARSLIGRYVVFLEGVDLMEMKGGAPVWQGARPQERAYAAHPCSPDS